MKLFAHILNLLPLMVNNLICAHQQVVSIAAQQARLTRQMNLPFGSALCGVHWGPPCIAFEVGAPGTLINGILHFQVDFLSSGAYMSSLLLLLQKPAVPTSRVRLGSRCPGLTLYVWFAAGQFQLIEDSTTSLARKTVTGTRNSFD